MRAGLPAGSGALALLMVLPVLAQQRVWAPIQPGTIFESGDTWVSSGKRTKLYGVRACERGRKFINASGVQHDCGEASLAMLVSLIRDLSPVCTEVARDEKAGISYVVCLALPDRGAGKGSRLDLGTALISSGFGFAARDMSGRPVHQEYSVAEEVAKRGKVGLWAFLLAPQSQR